MSLITINKAIHLYPKATISLLKQVQLFFLLIIFLAIPAVSHALTYYVDGVFYNMAHYPNSGWLLATVTWG